jgi:glycosyltransferase involved in cell wall biosynthesis
VGDAARLVNPDNSKDIADSMLEMMNQETRERWRARGLKRAAFFDWLEVGKQTAAVYRRAARTS